MAAFLACRQQAHRSWAAVGLDAFEVQVEFGQSAASLAEGPEVGGFLHCRNARQLFAQIVSKALAVVRGMEEGQ